MMSNPIYDLDLEQKNQLTFDTQNSFHLVKLKHYSQFNTNIYFLILYKKYLLKDSIIKYQLY